MIWTRKMKITHKLQSKKSAKKPFNKNQESICQGCVPIKFLETGVIIAKTLILKSPRIRKTISYIIWVVFHLECSELMISNMLWIWGPVNLEIIFILGTREQAVVRFGIIEYKLIKLSFKNSRKKLCEDFRDICSLAQLIHR